MINFARSMQAQLIEEMVPKRVEDFTNKELLELKQNIIKLNANILKELRKRNIFVNINSIFYNPLIIFEFYIFSYDFYFLLVIF